MLAAVFSAMYRPSLESSCASTRTILQFGQVAETMSRSRDSSRVQSSEDGASGGSGEVAPVWLTLVKLAAGSPAADR